MEVAKRTEVFEEVTFAGVGADDSSRVRRSKFLQKLSTAYFKPPITSRNKRPCALTELPWIWASLLGQTQ